jgi:hypothetical protein
MEHHVVPLAAQEERSTGLSRKSRTKFEISIKPEMAKALGPTIPPSLLVRADSVIEWVMSAALTNGTQPAAGTEAIP